MPAVESEARALLQELQQAADAGFIVTPDEGGVAVALPDSGLDFYHSFISGALVDRARQPGQALLKACNDRKRSLRRVLDLTTGWGADSLALATHGQQVVMLEQDDLVYAVTAHSIDCLRASTGGKSLAARLQIRHINALDMLYEMNPSEAFDCIYIDPMFPSHHSGAKPAKAMQILQGLTGNLDIERCFELALARALRRVVVKRPARGPALTELKPDLEYREKTVRFDVYLTG